MTSMIGYLELLRDSGALPEREQGLAAMSYEKAMKLKDMTDDLFKYFLMFGSSRPDMEMEDYDAGILMEQLIGEAEYDLRDAGFDVRRIDIRGQYTVQADPMYLKRVMDNLVSNARKYADKSRPVMFICEVSGGRLSFCMSNNIAVLTNPVESTKIGLRTCEKIMEHMHGSFTTRRDESHFAAEFSMPIK